MSTLHPQIGKGLVGEIDHFQKREWGLALIQDKGLGGSPTLWRAGGYRGWSAAGASPAAQGEGRAVAGPWYGKGGRECGITRPSTEPSHGHILQEGAHAGAHLRDRVLP